MTTRGFIGSTLSIIGTAGLGAGIMYLFDPDRGPRRRRQLSRTASHLMHDTTDAVSCAWHDLLDRLRHAGHDVGDYGQEAAGEAAYRVRQGRRGLSRAADYGRDFGEDLLERIHHLREQAISTGEEARQELPTYYGRGYGRQLMNRLRHLYGQQAASTGAAAGLAGLFGGPRDGQRRLKRARKSGQRLWERLSDAGHGVYERARDAGHDLSEYGHSLSKRARQWSGRSGGWTGGRSKGWTGRHKAHMSPLAIALTALGSIAVGAQLMYLLDPDRGRRRRALLRDKMISGAHELEDAARVTGRHVRDRSRGIFAELRSLFRRGPVSDPVLEARVRSRIGRAVTHPSSIHVTVINGRVTLTGPVLRHEVPRLLAVVCSMRGVKEVDNGLDVHDRPDGVPGLQGSGQRASRAMMQENWNPTTRLLVGLTGGAMGFTAAARRDPLGIAVGVLGLALITRAATNMPAKRLIGIGAGRRAVDIQKTININAPVEMVFDFWRNFENFPKFMTHVRQVRDLGDGRSHWVVDGPPGVPVEWDAEITKLQPPRILAWKSVEGSLIGHAGIIHFDPNPDGSTRVDIKMSYNPPGGALAHAEMWMYGRDPKHQMDEDLMRMKTMIETGKAPHDAAAQMSM